VLIVLSGPSGVGKSLTLRHLVSWHLCETIIPFTTRHRRSLELDGVDYYFRSEAILRALFDDFRTGYWDRPLGVDWYGYSAMVDPAVVQQQCVVIQASSGIALALKTRHPRAHLIFCDFASDDTMHRRIGLRCESRACDLEVRLKHAKVERSRKSMYDVVVTSDDPFKLRDAIIYELKQVVRGS
jgi:guanylate kinase